MSKLSHKILHTILACYTNKIKKKMRRNSFKAVLQNSFNKKIILHNTGQELQDSPQIM